MASIAPVQHKGSDESDVPYFTLIYADVLRAWRRQSSVGPGVVLGVGKGWMPALFDLVAHVIYGAIAGAIYTHRPRKPQGYDTLRRA